MIDDSEAVRTALEVLLSLEGAEVAVADSPRAGLDRVAEGDIDLVIQDMNFSREATFAGNPRPLGKLLFFLYFHESYHVGQTEIFRQLAGKDDKII